MYLIAAQTCVLVDTWTSLSGRIRHISGVGISIQACLTGRTPPTRRWLAQWVERASSVQRFGPRCSSRVRVPTWGLLHVTPISLILFVVILSAVLSIKPYKGKKKPCQMRTNWRRLLGRQTSRWPHLTCRHIHLNRTGGSGDGRTTWCTEEQQWLWIWLIRTKTVQRFNTLILKIWGYKSVWTDNHWELHQFIVID